MQKVIGIALIVIGIWVGIEVYTQGVDGAFGGALSFLSSDGAKTTEPTQTATPPDNRTIVRRTGDRVQADIDQGTARIEAQAEKEE